ncbi:hypothetical protein FO440_00190 [Mucilaginibacter corticis]|uniref:Probable sensor domain-containing protein n=1 Tax=Mucilaginibacter corticis TaxID=2597670 RepID=A0A556MRQ6_9SPHI|nr:hypothetical protein [Mucilaginibacter corticis]TSJ42646.1 hypothetical protein FO440_00190 [Mucilaginibacter corticis]
MPKHDQPADLAKYVSDYFKGLKTFKRPKPSATLLTDLFNCLYYASMQTEEGELTQVAVCLYNPDEQNEEVDLDEEPIDHWQFTAFNEPIPLTTKSIVKISKAADPWSTTIAVYYDEAGELFIHGLIDQAIHNQSYINYESDGAPAFPGELQVTIQGIGIIAVTRGRRLLGILRQHILVKSFLDVLGIGQLSDLLELKSKSSLRNVEQFLKKNYPEEEYEEVEELVFNVWRDTLSRLFIQIRKYHHGGAILITKDKKNLDIKYPFVYKRLFYAMNRFVKVSLQYENIKRKVSRLKTIPKDDFDLFINVEFWKKEVSNELKGAIRFIASQTCVDGLIVFNEKLETLGFGAVIENISPPNEVYYSPNAEYKDANLIKRNPQELGTRHRSMMTYCAENEGSIGIVISQDGDIRIMSLFDRKLIVWENVKTQRYLRASISVSPPKL